MFISIFNLTINLVEETFFYCFINIKVTSFIKILVVIKEVMEVIKFITTRAIKVALVTYINYIKHSIIVKLDFSYFIFNNINCYYIKNFHIKIINSN